MRRILLCVGCVPALLAGVSGICLAQTAQLTGRVTDSSGAVLPGAAIIVSNVKTGISRTVVSNEEGYYSAPFLLPATYRITVQHVGFRSITRDEITLSVDQVARLDFSLELEGLREEVRVEAQAPLLERETSSVSQVIENRTIVTLPLNGRNYSHLVALTSGAVPNSRARAEDAFHLNGNRSFQNSFLVDGLDNNNAMFGVGDGSTQITKPSVDSIQEFRVDTANYSAEYGRAAGGVINVSVKSGTNAFRGSTFEFLRHEALDATDFFAKRAGLTSPPLRFHQFGGTLGGPLLRNRAFFFASYQGTRERETHTATVTVPTPEMVQGNFGSLPIYDPRTIAGGVRQPFPDNIIPPERIDSVGQRLALLYPPPNRPGLVNNFVGPVRRSEDHHQLDLRVDHQLNDAARVFVRYSWTREELLQGSLFGSPGHGHPALAALSEIQQRPLAATSKASSLVAGETHVLANNLVNEFRAGYAAITSETRTLVTKPLFEEFGITGIPLFPGLNGLPVITVAGFGTLGDRNNVPAHPHFRIFQVADHLSWIRGAHTMKIGGEVRLRRNVGDQSINARGGLNFDGQFTSRGPGRDGGSAIADLLLGQTRQALLSTKLQGDMRDHYYAAYIHDTWKALPKLSVNLGLRYELQTPMWERENRMANFDADTTSPTFGMLVPSRPDRVRSRTFSNLDTNNIAPRVGFAYEVRPTTLVRGAFGIFSGSPGYQALVNSPAANIPFFVRRIDRSSDDASISSFVLADGFSPDALDPSSVKNPSAVSIPREFPLGEVQQWNVGVHRALIGHSEVSLTYVGSNSSHLRGLREINAPVPGPGAADARRPFPGYSTILESSAFVDGSYHALQAKMERRVSRGLALLGSYTWSHAIDNSVDLGDTDGTPASTSPQNPYDLKAERASANFDVRHRLVTSFIYDLPAGPIRSRLARLLFGGWQVAGVFVAQSGVPMTPTLNRNPANTTTPVRPDCLREGNLPRGQRTIERWFDVSAFAPAARFTYGNCGRNVLRAPGLVNLDLLIARSFLLTGEKRLELRGEFFNFTNVVHLGRPNVVVDLPQAGQITSTQAPARQVQIGLRFVF